MSVPDSGAQGHKIGLVLAGGGARGAYELGVLRRLLPWLAARLKQEPGWPDDIDVETWRPHIIVGTSVGALNAAFLAATADEPLDQALDDGCNVWQQITWDKALANLVSLSSARTGVSTLLDLTKVPGFHADRSRRWPHFDAGSAGSQRALERRLDPSQWVRRSCAYHAPSRNNR